MKRGEICLNFTHAEVGWVTSDIVLAAYIQPMRRLEEAIFNTGA